MPTVMNSGIQRRRVPSQTGVSSRMFTDRAGWRPARNDELPGQIDELNCGAGEFHRWPLIIFRYFTVKIVELMRRIMIFVIPNRRRDPEQCNRDRRAIAQAPDSSVCASPLDHARGSGRQRTNKKILGITNVVAAEHESTVRRAT